MDFPQFMCATGAVGSSYLLPPSPYFCLTIAGSRHAALSRHGVHAVEHHIQLQAPVVAVVSRALPEGGKLRIHVLLLTAQLIKPGGGGELHKGF